MKSSNENISNHEFDEDRLFLTLLSAPARRALENNEIFSLKQLTAYREEEILQFHGLGPSSLPKLRQALAEKGLSFRGV